MALLCSHANPQMFSVLNEMHDRSQRVVVTVITASIGCAFTIYLVVALAGYLSFGASVGGSIIAMYEGSLAATLGRSAIVLLFLFSYPLQCHPCRASLDHALRWRTPSSAPISDLRFALLTTAILVGSYIGAMTVSSLELVLAFVGATGSTAISFILPGFFYYRISSLGPLPHHLKMGGFEERWRRQLRWVAFTLACYGLVVMTLCLSMNIVKLNLDL